MFTRLWTLFICMAFLINFSGIQLANAQPKNNKSITIPSGTVVPITFKYPIDSDTLQNNDLLSIVVDEDVYVDNNLVFKKGTNGLAYISKTIHSGHHGRPGYILIREGKIKDINNNNHPIKLSIEATGESKRPSAIFLSVVGVAMILIPFGIWRTGTPATLSSAKVMQGFITATSTL